MVTITWDDENLVFCRCSSLKTTRLKTSYLLDKPRQQAVLVTTPPAPEHQPFCRDWMKQVTSPVWAWQGLLMDACIEATERGALVYHEELAKGNMWENVMSFVLPTDLLWLLPELGQLLSQGAGGAQVEDVLPGQGVVEEWVTHVGEQPEREKELLGWQIKPHIFSAKSASPVLPPSMEKISSSRSGREVHCLTCSPLPLLSNAENWVLVSDWGSEDLARVTASAFLPFGVQNAGRRALNLFEKAAVSFLSRC